MAVAQGVPLSVADDRVKGVVLEQEHPARRQPGGAFGQRRRLVGACIIPKQSTITSAPASPATWVRPRAVSSSSQDPPCGLPYSATCAPAGSSPAAATRPTASRRLGDESGRLGAPWLLGHGRIGQQLGQPAIRQSHICSG